MSNVTQLWQHRSLTLSGRTLVVNTLLSSLLVDLQNDSTERYFTASVKTDLCNYIYQFIWKGKKARASMQLVQYPRQSGGARLVNIEARQMVLKIMWIFQSVSFSRRNELL